ncbi:MAG: carbamoyltransferase HypF [Anaerolineaceae bacterium]|nr:carbamoyltransferase HypF [Anaerolineaceae bacterium]
MSADPITGCQVHIQGIVQGVGFRPFIYLLSMRYHLTGWVRNTSSGVEIEVNGCPDDITAFLQAIRTETPPLARIDRFETAPCAPDGYSSFEIIESLPQADDFIPVSPDMSICPDCQRELFDPHDRRYRYPFINCTNCGPRFTIIQDIPYDRPKTTMAGFNMCAPCRHEYVDPLDRRFHAQPTACPDCGPQVSFVAEDTPRVDGDEAIRLARQFLRQGKILAVKGLGGYHLACDAFNPQAVDELRRRKRRSDRPFALMAFDLDAALRHCTADAGERALLESRQRPIVLLEQKPSSLIAAQVAPGQQSLGIMLAYTPLHLLLLEPEEGFPDLLVMTSGNLSEEPIAYQDADAKIRLQGIADGFLLHDRPIHMRVDDSVLREVDGGPYPIRRSRGYAPDPILLQREFPPILGAGAELKNTVCVTREKYAFLSHHIGDLENLETLQSYQEGIQHFERLFRVKPEVLACDLHPDYLSSVYAHQRAAGQNLPLYQVQHHHAHLAACLADNGWDSPEPVIGLSFDGTGYGPDGAIWGGEFLVGDYHGYQRPYHLAYAPLPGGDASVHRPARMALAHLWQAGIEWEAGLPPVQDLCAEERTVLRSQLEHHINTPLTSSLGRLFDAAAALIGVRQKATYEGQAAIELEIAADPHEQGLYELEIKDGLVDPGPLWQALIADWHNGLPVNRLSARFHNSIAQLSLQICRILRTDTNVRNVALSGGVWQNRYLLERSLRLLREDGFHVLLHRQVPTNDGGIALGQIMVAAYNHFIH